MIRQLKEESRILARRSKELQAKLKKAPKGSLLCNKNGKYSKWFYSEKASRYSYLPKKERALAESLALKRYMQTQLEGMLKKKEAIDQCLSAINEYDVSMEFLTGCDSPYLELIQSHLDNFSEKLSAWVDKEYIANPDYPENKKFHTKKGDLVRSKSEVFIADALYLHKIPYHYEEKLELNEYGFFYPDFTICHPKTLQILYWEHFGMMDNEDYIHKAFRKLDIYALNQILPTHNLITTYESRENPLDPEVVEQIIRMYFL